MNHLFLLGCHKSGTSLLRSMLDGHPDVFAVPIEAHYFRLTGSWISYPLKASPPRQMEHKQKIRALQNWIHDCNHPPPSKRLAHADGDTSNMWDEKIVAEKLSLIRGDASNRDIYQAYIGAMHAALFQDGRLLPRVAVEKSVEQLDIVPQIARVLPHSRFVHIIRNPYANLVAIRKSRKRFSFLARELFSIYRSFERANHNVDLIPNYKVIKFEDLVLNPKKVIEEVAEFAGIEVDDSLVSPSSMGSTWAGNSTSGQSFSGISKAPLSHWKDSIHP